MHNIPLCLKITADNDGLKHIKRIFVIRISVPLDQCNKPLCFGQSPNGSKIIVYCDSLQSLNSQLRSWHTDTTTYAPNQIRRNIISWTRWPGHLHIASERCSWLLRSNFKTVGNCNDSIICQILRCIGVITYSMVLMVGMSSNPWRHVPAFSARRALLQGDYWGGTGHNYEKRKIKSILRLFASNLSHDTPRG